MLPVIAPPALPVTSNTQPQANSPADMKDNKTTPSVNNSVNNSDNKKDNTSPSTTKPLAGIYDMYKNAMGINKEDHGEAISSMRHEEITGTLTSIKENTRYTNVLLEELLKKKFGGDEKSSSLLPLLAGLLGKLLSALLDGLKGLLGAFKLPRISMPSRVKCCCGSMGRNDRDRPDRDRRRDRNSPDVDVDVDRPSGEPKPNPSPKPKPKPKPKMGKGKLALIAAAVTTAAATAAAVVTSGDDDEEKEAQNGTITPVPKANDVLPVPDAPSAGVTAAVVGGAGLATLGVAAKMGVKALPGIGLAAGVGFGAMRALEGDFVGAGLEVLSGFAGLLPGLGTAASLTIQAGLLARDNGVDVAGTLEDVSTGIIATTGTLATGVIGSITSTAISAKDTTVEVASSLIESGAGAITGTVEAATGVIGNVLGAIGGISGKIVGIVSGLASTLGAGVIGAVGGLAAGVIGTVSTLGSTITSFASGVWSKISNSPLVNTIKDAAGNVVNTVKNVFNGAATAGSNTRNSDIKWSKEATPEVFKAIGDASAKHGVSEDHMKTMAYFESRGDPTANRGAKSAKGLYQFVPGTARAYGIEGQELDVNKNADAAAKMAASDKASLTKFLGREPEPWMLYLAHNQGLGGAKQILRNMAEGTNNVSAEVRSNMNNQKFGDNLSATQFAEHVRDKYNRFSNGINGQQGNVVSQRQQQAASVAAAPLAAKGGTNTPVSTTPLTSTKRTVIRAGTTSKSPSENLAAIRTTLEKNPTYYKGNIVELVTGLEKDPKDTSSVAEQIKLLAANGADVRLVKVTEGAGHRAKVGQSLNKTLAEVASANKTQMITKPFTSNTERMVTATIPNLVQPNSIAPTAAGVVTGGSGGSAAVPTTTPEKITPAASQTIPVESEGTKPTQGEPTASDSELIAVGKRACKWGRNAVENGMNPAFLEKFYAMAGEYANKTKKGILIGEAFRSSARQAELRRKDPSKAAKPGLSMHEYGLAMDIGTDTGNLLASTGLLKKYGFVRPYGNEPWHIEHESTRAQRHSLRKNDDATRSKAASLIAGTPINAGAVPQESGSLSSGNTSLGGMVDSAVETARGVVNDMFNTTPDAYVQDTSVPTLGFKGGIAGQITPTTQFKRTSNNNVEETSAMLERFNEGGSIRPQGNGQAFIESNPNIFNGSGSNISGIETYQEYNNDTGTQQGYNNSNSTNVRDTSNSIDFSRVVPEQYSGTTFGKSVNFLLDNINNVRNRDYNSLTKSVLGAVGQTDFMKSSPLLSSISSFITGNLDNVENKNYTGLASNLLNVLGSPKTAPSTVQPNTGVVPVTTTPNSVTTTPNSVTTTPNSVTTTPNSVMRNIVGANPTKQPTTTDALLKDISLVSDITSVLPTSTDDVFETSNALQTSPTLPENETVSMDRFNAQVRTMLAGQSQATIGSVSSGVPTSTLSVTPTPSTKPTSFIDKLKSVGSFVNDNLGSIDSGDYNTLTGNALSALGGTVNKTPTNIIDRSLAHATNFVTNNSESIKNGDYSSVLNNAITSLGGDSNSGFGGILSKAGSFVTNNSESIKNGDYSSVISGIGSFFGSRNKHGQAQPNTTDLVASQDGKPMDIMKYVSGISSAPLTNVGSDLITATPSTDLRPPNEERLFTPSYDAADAVFTKATSDYAEQTNKPPTIINQSPQTNNTVNNTPGNSNGKEGVDSPIRVRNTDSVIREAMVAFMKQTM